jgi:hypothetical protein
MHRITLCIREIITFESVMKSTLAREDYGEILLLLYSGGAPPLSSQISAGDGIRTQNAQQCSSSRWFWWSLFCLHVNKLCAVVFSEKKGYM